MRRAEGIHERLDSFAALEEGWDSYGSHRITAEAIAAAKVVVDSIGVVPTVHGGVGVYLANEGVIIEIGPDGEVVDTWLASRDVTDYVRAVLSRGDASGAIAALRPSTVGA